MIIKRCFGKIEFIKIDNKKIENDLGYILYKLQNNMHEMSLEYNDRDSDHIYGDELITFPFGIYKINFSISTPLLIGYYLNTSLTRSTKFIDIVICNCSKFFYYDISTKHFKIDNKI